MSEYKLSDVIDVNSNFKTAVNLYLSLNKTEKILNYIPTQSSVAIMSEYIDAITSNKEHATILIGPYGKGKSHLLLVLLGIVSLIRNKNNNKTIKQVIDNVSAVDGIGKSVAGKIKQVWGDKRPFLPVILNDSKGDLNQSFLLALNDALKRERIENLMPDTYFSEALKRISDWEENYSETYSQFSKELRERNCDVETIVAGLKRCSKEQLDLFVKIYPKITAGSQFNPLVVSEVLPLYKSVSEKLVEDYGYRGIYIVFDEFSKFIEGIDGHAVGNNMKLLQDICELANDSSNAQIFITMVAHKSIKEYGKYLSAEIINAFTGIEGRIIEKYFVSSSKNNYELIKNAISKDEKKLSQIAEYKLLTSDSILTKYYQVPAFKSKFEIDDFNGIVLKGCYPLNPISAYLLLSVSEKAAQNERTLFTFISNDEPNSMPRFMSNQDENAIWSIGADLIYDYFSSLFKKDVSNSISHSIWIAAEYALSKCDSDEEKKIVKSLAVILIVNKYDEIPATGSFLTMAVDPTLDTKCLDDLESRNIIQKKSSTNTYIFTTRSGSEFNSEMKRRRELKGNNVNFRQVLGQITSKYYVIPRKYNTETMMTRFFRHEYMDIDTFLKSPDSTVFFDKKENADGLVITLFTFNESKIDLQVVKRHLKVLNCSNLIINVPGKALKIANILKDFEIIQEIKKSHAVIANSELVKREIPLMEEEIVFAVENHLFDVYENNTKSKTIYILSGKVIESRCGSEEKAVNDCCDVLFTDAPFINNEIIYRNNLTSAQTKKARVNIIEAIIAHRDDENFYSGTNQEATIYRSLFCMTGIVGSKEKDINLENILRKINSYIDDCCGKKISPANLVSELIAAPIGLRAAVLPIYMAHVFSLRQEDLVIYYSGVEVQLSPDVIVDFCERSSLYELLVSKEDFEKEKYISSLNDLFEVDDNRNLSENRIKNIIICMQRWFRKLPQVARNMSEIGKNIEAESYVDKMTTLKNILQRVEYNSFEILFEEIPREFSAASYDQIVNDIITCKNLFDKYYEWITGICVMAIYDTFSGRKKIDLFHLTREWYDRQSLLSKEGLHSGRITNFMSAIEGLVEYDDTSVAEKIVKAATDVYIENWSDGAFDSFITELAEIKSSIENIKDDNNSGKMKLSFIGRNGDVIERYYELAEENNVGILRNILSDQLDDFDDLSVNDRVSVLLDLIEQIMK